MQNLYANFVYLVFLISSCTTSQISEINFEVITFPSTSGPFYVKLENPPAPETPLGIKFNDDTIDNIPLQHWKDSIWVGLNKPGLPKELFNAGHIEKLNESLQIKVRVEMDSIGLTLFTGAKPVLTFNTKTLFPPDGSPNYYQRSGFIHPLYSPAGQILTDDFPVGHTHQHGIFMTWVNTTFKGEKVDFWNQHDELGTVRLIELTDTLSGPVFAQFKAKLEHLSLKNGPALTEEWTVTVYNSEDSFLIDFHSAQQTATSDTLYLNPYHYGGFAFRASKEWNKEDSTHYTNAMQIQTSLGHERDSSNHTRPEWIAGYGEIDNQIAGLAVFGHPDNFRHPQPVRVHPGMPYFCFAPMVEGGFPIAPGDVYVSKYRLLAFSGPPNLKKMDQIWLDYKRD